MAIIHSMYNESGKAVIDGSLCTVCGKCAEICPAEVLTKRAGKIDINCDNFFGCIACGHCMMVCPHDAIKVTGRGLSPDDVTPLPQRDDMASADELQALMLNRRSIRHFSDKPVARELIDRILAMASTAPMGIPPWDVGCVTICDKTQRQHLVREIIKGYEGLLKTAKPWLIKLLRPVIGKAKYDMFASFILPLAQGYVNEYKKNNRDVLFYDAPAVMIFHHAGYADPTDASIACTYAMLAAESLGLGTIMIGAAAPIMQRNKKICRALGIPDGNKPSIVLLVGYPKYKFRKGIKRQFTDNRVI